MRTAIYDRMERSYQLRREETPEKLVAFHRALEDLLGKSAEVIQKLIAKNLYSRLGLDFVTHENWTLVDYVNHAKERRRDG